MHVQIPAQTQQFLFAPTYIWACGAHGALIPFFRMDVDPPKKKKTFAKLFVCPRVYFVMLLLIWMPCFACFICILACIEFHMHMPFLHAFHALYYVLNLDFASRLRRIRVDFSPSKQWILWQERTRYTFRCVNGTFTFGCFSTNNDTKLKPTFFFACYFSRSRSFVSRFGGDARKTQGILMCVSTSVRLQCIVPTNWPIFCILFIL